MRCTKTGQVNLEYKDALSSMQECEAQMDRLSAQRQAFCSQSADKVKDGILKLLGLPKLNDHWNAIETRHESQRDVEEYRYQLDCEGQYPVPVIVRIPSVANQQSKVCIHLADAGKASLLIETDRRDAFSDGTIHVYADLRGFGETSDIFEYNLSKYWNTQYRSAVTALHAGKPLIGQRVQDLRTILNFCSADERSRSDACCCARRAIGWRHTHPHIEDLAQLHSAPRATRHDVERHSWCLALLRHSRSSFVGKGKGRYPGLNAVSRLLFST